MKIATFILVLDSYLVRKGVITILNRMQGVRVVKEFGSDSSFYNYLRTHPVDFLIMGQSEFERSVELFVTMPELLEKIILLRGAPGEKAVSDSPMQDVHTSIHLMEEKESIIQKIQGLLDQTGSADSESLSMSLSPREITIVRLVSMGLTNRQIAEKLFLSAHTVMTHRKNISAKLGIKSVSGLTVYAIVNNIITIDDVSSLPPR